MLAVNFERALEEALGEAALWERLRLVVPGAAVEALAQRDSLRKLRVRASTIARQYNEARAPPGRCTASPSGWQCPATKMHAIGR